MIGRWAGETRKEGLRTLYIWAPRAKHGAMDTQTRAQSVDYSPELLRVLRSAGPWCVVYTNASEDENDPHRTVGIRYRDVVDALRDQGAAEADLAEVQRVLASEASGESPASRYLVVGQGETVIDEVFPGEMLAAPVAAVTAVADVTALLLHRPPNFRYLVVEVGHDGGELYLFTAGKALAEQEEHVPGELENVHKVRTGGWSDLKHQHRTEEVWKRNQGLVARQVDLVVEREHPQLVIVAGDVKAVELLTSQLSKASLAAVVTVHLNVRPADASHEGLTQRIDDEIARALGAEKADALLRLRARAAGGAGSAAGSGSGGGAGVGAAGAGSGGGAEAASGAAETAPLGVAGIEEVVDALRAHQVEALLLPGAGLDTFDLVALAEQPWIDARRRAPGEAPVVAEVSARAALIRAAILSGARVIFAGDDELPIDAHVAATLRWPAAAQR